MQIESFDWFVGREKGRPCLVAGNAPTIANFPYSSFDGIYIAVGDGPLRLKKYFEANYWVNANDMFPVPEDHLAIINSFKDTVFILSDSAAYCRTRTVDPAFLQKSLTVDWFAYDQRHFNAMPCEDRHSKCCTLLNIYPDRPTIQEFFQHHYGTDIHYSTASTVAIHALAFAIMMGCHPIYLQGIEIPVMRSEYVYAPSTRLALVAVAAAVKPYLGSWYKVFNPRSVYRVARPLLAVGLSRSGIVADKTRSLFYDNIEEILSDFKYLVDVADANGISVVNLSNTSSLNDISSLEYQDPCSIA